jgi:hypothetical protein
VTPPRAWRRPRRERGRSEAAARRLAGDSDRRVMVVRSDRTDDRRGSFLLSRDGESTYERKECAFPSRFPLARTTRTPPPRASRSAAWPSSSRAV